MNADAAKQPRCPACRSTDLVQIGYQREFRPHGNVVVVDLLALRCDSCGAESTRSAQHNENLARMKARKAEYGGLLLGEDILALRRRYGITQQQAAKIFGKGKIAFSRYENEVSYPDAGTTNLLELAIQKPDVIKWLADKVGVDLPLWGARCKDERDVRAADPAALRLAQKELSASGKRAGFAGVSFPLNAERWNTEMVNRCANDDRFHFSEAAFG
jgi:HTH-type transcriptional regulator/antitoxin MqsA